MIETVGNGIQKIFSIQRDRFFPMPDYDISDETHTSVTIHGELISENYTNLLYSNPELTIEDVIALDKVQKKQEISEKALNRLRLLKMVKGRRTSLEIVGTDKMERFSNKDYKQMILNLLVERGSASKEEVEKFLLPLLPKELTVSKKQKKISNLISELSFQEARITNISTSKKFPVWQIAR
jgi:ATP-dependent DNA helicase RecG